MTDAERVRHMTETLIASLIHQHVSDRHERRALTDAIDAMPDAYIGPPEALREALSDAFNAMDAACKWASGEAMNLRTPLAADRHIAGFDIAGFDALVDATAKAGMAAGILHDFAPKKPTP